MFAIFSYAKIIALIAGLSLIGMFVWGGINYVKTSEQNRVKVQLLQQEITEKENAIKTLEEIMQLQNSIIIEKDKNIEELNKSLEDIAENLGDGADDQAPAAIKEIINRLRGIR